MSFMILLQAVFDIGYVPESFDIRSLIVVVVGPHLSCVDLIHQGIEHRINLILDNELNLVSFVQLADDDSGVTKHCEAYCEVNACELFHWSASAFVMRTDSVSDS